MFRDYLINRLYLQRINLKRPISRGGRFKIYFRLENRKNRGSRQNFHGIPFSKDRVLINRNRYVTLQIYHNRILILKIKQFKTKHGCKNTITKINQFIPKREMKQ